MPQPAADRTGHNGEVNPIPNFWLSLLLLLSLLIDGVLGLALPAGDVAAPAGAAAGGGRRYSGADTTPGYCVRFIYETIANERPLDYMKLACTS